MEKNIIQVVLQSEEKKAKESPLMPLLRKKRFVLFITLAGLVMGLIISPLYYLSEIKNAEEKFNSQSTQQSDIISEKLYDRQFLMQSTREREPGNLHIAEQLRYDIFLIRKTMIDIVTDLSKNNKSELKASFEAFQSSAIEKISLININDLQDMLEDGSISTIKINDYILKYPYLMINDDKEALKAKLRENQSLMDTYNLAIISSDDNINSAEMLVYIESLKKANKILGELIQGNITNDPDPRGTQIVYTQINALCETLDEVKLELLNEIDENSMPAPIIKSQTSLLKVIAIGAVFPCMMFVLAILLVMLSDWWQSFIKEQLN